MRKSLFLILLLGFIFIPTQYSTAESYDIYVNADAKDNGDGSKDKPFKQVSDALKKAKSGENIFIASGSYDGEFEVPEKVSLFGKDRDDVKINGMVTINNGVTLENITFIGRNTGILVNKNARVTISKCIVRDALKIGIDAVPGNGKLVVKNTRIYDNGKGFYVQMGNQFQLINSKVYDNGEEGIDLRNDNDGFIQGNEIYNNGESGIEIILGKTDMLISGNTIKNNKSSGIATQFYPDFNDTGRLIVKNNKITDNSHFAVKCGIPQGGAGLTRTYWQESIELEKNVFGGNGKGDIEKRCKILTEAEKAEIERLENEAKEKADILKAQKIEAEKTEEQKRLEEEERIEKEAKAIEAFREHSISLEIEWKSLEVDMNQKIEIVEKQNRFSFWLFGPKKEKIEEIENDLNSGKQKISEMEEIIEQAPNDETKSEIQNKIISLNQAVSEKESLLENLKKDLSFWQRTKNIFRK